MKLILTEFHLAASYGPGTVHADSLLQQLIETHKQNDSIVLFVTPVYLLHC